MKVVTKDVLAAFSHAKEEAKNASIREAGKAEAFQAVEDFITTNNLVISVEDKEPVKEESEEQEIPAKEETSEQ